MSSTPPSQDLNTRLLLLEQQNQALKERIRTLSYENRDQNQLILSLLEKTPFGMVIFDRQYRLLRINRTAEDMLGMGRSQAVGKPCTHLFECHQLDSRCPVIDGGVNLDRVVTNCAGQASFGVSLLRSAVRINNKDEDIILESFVDITEIKKAQQAKDDFLAKMSHELRTPLNAVLGYSDLLKEELGEVLDGEQEKFLDSISRAGSAMLQLVNGLLDFSQFKANTIRLTLTEFELETLVSEILEQMAAELKVNHNQVVVRSSAPLPVMHSDRFRLRQILLNLLANANKFSKDSLIEWVVTTVPAAGLIRFDIIDQGIGMDEEQQLRIFKPFEQADNSRTRSYGGIGLGLTLSREFARLLGGEVSVISNQGQGSTFTLALPIALA